MTMSCSRNEVMDSQAVAIIQPYSNSLLGIKVRKPFLRVPQEPSPLRSLQRGGVPESDRLKPHSMPLCA